MVYILFLSSVTDILGVNAKRRILINVIAWPMVYLNVPLGLIGPVFSRLFLFPEYSLISPDLFLNDIFHPGGKVRISSHVFFILVWAAYLKKSKAFNQKGFNRITLFTPNIPKLEDFFNRYAAGYEHSQKNRDPLPHTQTNYRGLIRQI